MSFAVYIDYYLERCSRTSIDNAEEHFFFQQFLRSSIDILSCNVHPYKLFCIPLKALRCSPRAVVKPSQTHSNVLAPSTTCWIWVSTVILSALHNTPSAGGGKEVKAGKDLFHFSPDRQVREQKPPAQAHQPHLKTKRRDLSLPVPIGLKEDDGRDKVARGCVYKKDLLYYRDSIRSRDPEICFIYDMLKPQVVFTRWHCILLCSLPGSDYSSGSFDSAIPS
ncbi:hypothetical protein BJ166DRAFT_142578 [Pestalotiopsis sp. NC0098]|nr:hypothetical protein BJ166DRAFT_142578 [Pestalotiopsis sp. NC0098]